MPAADPSDLAALPLFGSLSEAELAEAATLFELRDVEAGVQLTGEGTTGNSFFVVCGGELSVAANGKAIGTLRAGDFFGELALLGEGRRTATVTTMGPSRMLVMFGGDFRRFRALCPAITAELEAAVQRRLHP